MIFAYIDKLAKLANKRIEKQFAPYRSYAIFTILNYPLSFFFLQSELGLSQHESPTLRMISLMLNFILFFHNYWPSRLKPYLALYWYFTVCFSISILGSYLLIMNLFSLNWLMNFLIGMMLMVLIVDWLMSIFLIIVGWCCGYFLVILISDYTESIAQQVDYISLFFYMLVNLFLIIAIFARNNEVFNALVQSKLESAVNARTLELTKALTVKTEFLNNMSHELRTPIQGVDAISNGLVEHWEEFSEKVKYEYAKQIAKNSSRLLSLVSNLLDLSKLNSEKIILSYRRINVRNLVEDMIEECNILYIKDRNLKISFTLETEVKNLYINADYERITQVLRNLLVNAIKYTKDDKSHIIHLNISKSYIIRDEKKIEALNFAIKDEGVGIPEDELKDIFLQFLQSSRTKTKAGGVGLGLSICKEIIEAHDGVIWAENNYDNNGSTFHFIIPMKLSEIREAKKIAHQTIIRENKKDDVNILVIDDEDVCLMSVELILKSTNYNIVKAQTGAEGMEYLLKGDNKIDLILLDLMLPDINGLDLLIEIRNNSKLSAIPVLVQSGASDLLEIEKAYKIGVSGYIQKPYNKEMLITQINHTRLQAN